MLEKEGRLSRFSVSERAHGRMEERECVVCDNLYWLEGWKEWEGLRTFARIKSSRTVPGPDGYVKSDETRYYISSLKLDAKAISDAVKSHWGIENNLHWQLDVTFNEEDDRKKNNAAENFSCLAKVALALLQNDKTLKNSIRTKRKGAGWDNEYLHTLLFQDIF